MLVQRAAEYAPVFSLRAPAREGAYDTDTRSPTSLLHAMSESQQEMS